MSFGTFSVTWQFIILHLNSFCLIDKFSILLLYLGLLLSTGLLYPLVFCYLFYCCTYIFPFWFIAIIWILHFINFVFSCCLHSFLTSRFWNIFVLNGFGSFSLSFFRYTFDNWMSTYVNKYSVINYRVRYLSMILHL